MKCTITLAFLFLIVACAKKTPQLSKDSYLEDPLHLNLQLIEAAKSGDADQVKSLIAKGAEVNYKDRIGGTPLI